MYLVHVGEYSIEVARFDYNEVNNNKIDDNESMGVYIKEITQKHVHWICSQVQGIRYNGILITEL